MASVPMIAHVLCRSEGRAEEWPVAVESGGRRLEIEEILDDTIQGSSTAGGETRRCVLVRLRDGQVLRLERALPAGDWRVFRVSH